MVRRVVLVALVACAGTPRTSSDTRTLSGRVIDERGAPIAGAEIVLCTYHSLCDSVTSEAVASNDSLVQLAERFGRESPRSTYAVATTDVDGRWSVRAPDPDPVSASPATVVVTAPDREIVARPVSVARDAALRRAAPIDLDLHCGATPCPNDVTIMGDLLASHGTHFAHLEPGHHRFTVIVYRDHAGEMIGRVAIEVGEVAQRVPVDLTPTGTGLAIKGRVGGCPTADARFIVVRCGTGASARYRYIGLRSGAFEIDDVPSPPCTVAMTEDLEYRHRDGARLRRPNSNIGEDHDVTVSHLPASGLKLGDPSTATAEDELARHGLTDEEMAKLAEAEACRR